MGKKRAASQTVARKQTDKAVKLYEELTSLNDQLLTASSLTPNAKEIENSSREISELVQKILKLQTDDTETDLPSREQKLNKFISWCHERGAKSDKVELTAFEEFGLGLRATQKINVHDMFLCIPRSLMMVVDTKTSSIGQLLKTDPIASRMPNVALSLYLIAEKLDKSSSWRPYIDMLPRNYDTPLYFSMEEISLLKGSPTYEHCIHLQRNIARQYSYFWSIFTNQAGKYPVMAKHFTYDLYRWAVSTIMTRQNMIPKSPEATDVEVKGGDQNSLVLIPFWDMCNHKQGEMLTNYNEDLNECHCYAMDVCEPGDQVFICYGNRPNANFLVHNGFVCRDNCNDSVILRLGFSKTDKFVKTRQAILTNYGVKGESHLFFLGKPKDDSLPEDLLMFLRVFNASEDEMNLLVERESGDELRESLEPISEENDRKCWNFLSVRCSLLLRTYTGRFSDAEFLGQLDARHVTMATMQVEGEKAILNEVIALCDRKLAN